MDTKSEKKEKMVTIPEATYLSLIADKLKDRVLFPRKLEEARKMLKNIKTVSR